MHTSLRPGFRLFAACLFATLAVGCASNPLSRVSEALGGGKKETADDAPPEEKRISILALEQTLEADPRYAGTPISLPPPYKNVSWPQPGGEADHTLHHLTGAAALERVWTADIGKGASRRSRLTSPPIAADGKLYVLDTDASVSAFSMEDGKRLWRAKLAPKIKERFRMREMVSLSRTTPNQIGFGGGVAYDNGRIFVTSGFGFAAALDAATGEEVWRHETNAPVRTPPTAYRGAVYLVTNVNELIALDQASGAERWNYQSFEETARILSAASPAAAGDLVVSPFSSGEIVAVLAESGRPVWNDTLAKNSSLTALSALNDIAGSPVIDRGLVYVVSHGGRLAAIDIRTGDRAWEIAVASLQMPWVAGDYLFLVSVDAELICINREDGAIVWISKLRRYENEKKRKGRISWSGPVLAGEHLILASTRGEVVRVSAQDGTLAERRKVGAGVVIAPIVADDKVFILTDKGKMLALQ